MDQSTKTLLIINAVLYSVYAIGAFFVLPNYELLFESFNVELTGISLLIISTYRLWLIIPIIFIVTLSYFKGNKASPTTQKILFYIGVFSIVFGILFITIVTSAIYSVIFNMPIK
jgi:hypothetical protein